MINCLTPLPRSAYRFLCLLLTLAASVGFAQAAGAAILNVPSQYATIAAAVSAASSGDTIMLAPATYSASGDLNLHIGESITIESSGGATSTIINCGGRNDFIEEVNANNLTLTIQGLTILNCGDEVLDFGGSSGSSFNVNDCTFTNNNGGDIIDTDEAGNLTVTNCTFNNNSNSEGCLFASPGSTTLTNCTFSNNVLVSYSNSATLTISGCTFNHNGSANGDGAIAFLNGTLTITDTIFNGNVSAGGGGAISMDAAGLDTTLNLTRCLLENNSSAGYGGGAILLFEGDGVLALNATDCQLVGNSSSVDGAVISTFTGVGSGQIVLTNCSLYGNAYTGGSASGQGAISGSSDTNLTIANSILYGDTTPTEISTANPPSSISVKNSDIEQSGYNGTNGNIDTSPKYENAGVDDLHLDTGSPCIGAGTSTGAPATDFNSYAWGTVYSMGALSPILFNLTAPPSVTAGSQFSLGVTAVAEDQSTTITNYSGTVGFTSSDPSPILPGNSTLTNGTGTFGVTLNTAGSQSVTATDASVPAFTGTVNTDVVATPVNPPAATHFTVSAPASASHGSAFSVTVTALGANNKPATGYAGTVHLTSTDHAAVLPANATLTNGARTFTVTMETLGSQTVTATDTVTSSITGTSSQISVSAPSMHVFAAGLQMISAPSDYSAFSVEQIFQSSTIMMAVWQTGAKIYSVSPTPPANTIVPGQGYWVRLAATTNLPDIGVHTNPTKPVSIALAAGWNMIGDPFASSMPVASLTFTVGSGSAITYGAAVDEGIIGPTLYTFGAGATVYTAVGGTDTMEPYSGYWIDVLQSCTMTVPAS
jgi:hypothetical protein